MSFEWNKIHKYEDNYEREITDNVYDYVRDYFDVDEIDDITEEQMDQVKTFRDEYNEYSVMQIGFSNMINDWEDIQLEKEND
jgi:hypothetical protein